MILFSLINKFANLKLASFYDFFCSDEVKDTTECYCTNHVVDLLPDDSIVCVLVTAMISPIHFWVQFVFGPRPLDQLKVYCSESLERPWEEGETLESLNEAIK